MDWLARVTVADSLTDAMGLSTRLQCRGAGDDVRMWRDAHRLHCGFHDTNQRAGPGIRKAPQVVPGDIQIAESLEGVHKLHWELRQPIVS